MGIVHELVRSATDPDPVSVSPPSLARPEGKTGRTPSLVEQYNAARKVRLARMAHPPVMLPAEFYYSNMWFWDLINPRPLRQGRPLIARIIAKVAAHYGIEADVLTSERRDKGVIIARQVAIYLARELTVRSLPDIARRMGDRHHTTIIHSVRKVEQYIEQSPEMRDVIASLKKEILA